MYIVGSRVNSNGVGSFEVLGYPLNLLLTPSITLSTHCDPCGQLGKLLVSGILPFGLN